jgi:hypothetical protein
MIDKVQAVQSVADDLERLGAPLRLPEDWTIFCDHDDLQQMPRQSAKRLLTQAKKEAARRWLWERFDPTEMDLELSQEREEDDGAEELDERLLKQHAVNSINEVVSGVNSLRETHANLSCDTDMPAAHEATVAARISFGYPGERPIRTDCFDEDVRRQCRRVINEIFRCLETSSGPDPE